MALRSRGAEVVSSAAPNRKPLAKILFDVQHFHYVIAGGCSDVTTAFKSQCPALRLAELRYVRQTLTKRCPVKVLLGLKVVNTNATTNIDQVYLQRPVIAPVADLFQVHTD